MTEPVLRRDGSVIWRVTAGVVHVHRVTNSPACDAAADLGGLAAAVWAALDDPATVGQVGTRLRAAGFGDADLADLTAATDELVTTGWLTRESGGAAKSHVDRSDDADHSG